MLFSGSAAAQIGVASNFQVNAPLPTEVRDTMQSVSDTMRYNNSNVVVPGLVTFVIDENWYWYRDNLGWKEWPQGGGSDGNGIISALPQNNVSIKSKNDLDLDLGQITLFGESVLDHAKAKETQFLKPSDLESQDNFGSSVAIHDTTIAVGAFQTFKAPPNDNGVAYVYSKRENGWVRTAKLEASDGQSDDDFGSSIAMTDTVIVVGAEGESENGSSAGAAYVYGYDNGNWVERAKLLASDGAAGDRFGRSVAIDDTLIVVGAPNGEAAYIFGYDNGTWVERKKIVASAGQSSAAFGQSVAIYDTTIVVGCYRENAGSFGSGSAYIFTYDNGNWSQLSRLIPTDSQIQDEFGKSVAIHDTTIVVGSHQEDSGGTQCGAAYVYEYSNGNWTETTKLLPLVVGANLFFGNEVAINENAIVVSSIAPVGGAGHVFTYKDGEWTHKTKITASNGRLADLLGAEATAIYDTTIIMGARQRSYANPSLTSAGAAYIFDILPEKKTYINNEIVLSNDRRAKFDVGLQYLGFDDYSDLQSNSLAPVALTLSGLENENLTIDADGNQLTAENLGRTLMTVDTNNAGAGYLLLSEASGVPTRIGHDVLSSRPSSYTDYRAGEITHVSSVGVVTNTELYKSKGRGVSAVSEIDSVTYSISLNENFNGVFQIDMTNAAVANAVALSVSNPEDGGVYTFHFQNTNGNEVDLPSNFLDAAGSAFDSGGYVLSSDDFITCYYDGTNYYCK